jgi:cobalt-zinc-cadmium efflux system outer membrane protein
VPARLPPLTAGEHDLAALEAEAAEQRLDVLAAAASGEALARALALARRWRWVPLLEVGVTSDREPEGGWSLGPSLSLALPIFDQGQPSVARLAAAERRAARELEAARLDARSDVREAGARLAGARARAERLQRAVLPLHARLVELTLREYNYMLVGAFELLSARKDELAAYRDSLAARRDSWIAWSELELAVGRRLATAAAAAEPATPPEPREAPSPAPPTGHEHHHHGGHE